MVIHSHQENRLGGSVNNTRFSIVNYTRKLSGIFGHVFSLFYCCYCFNLSIFLSCSSCVSQIRSILNCEIGLCTSERCSAYSSYSFLHNSNVRASPCIVCTGFLSLKSTIYSRIVAICAFALIVSISCKNYSIDSLSCFSLYIVPMSFIPNV